VAADTQNESEGNATGGRHITSPAAGLLPSRLDQQFGLHSTDREFENWGGKEEKWIRDHGKYWYWITPAGRLYEWNHGQSAMLVASLDAALHSRPSLLHDTSDGTCGRHVSARAVDEVITRIRATLIAL